MTINRKLRGIRDPVDPGYILGRPKNMGKGPAVQLKAPVGLLTPQQGVDVLGGLPASGVTAGSYTNANITVNAKGIVTLAGNGSAGSLPALNDGQIWIGNGTNVAVARTPAGDVTISDTGATLLGNTTVTAGSYTNTNLTVDAKGRITAASNGSGSAPAFNGVRVKKASDQTTANYSAGAIVAWDAESFDTNSWHDNSTNNSRLTVPSGVTYAEFFACMSTDLNVAPEWRDFYLYKNGALLLTLCGHIATQLNNGFWAFSWTSGPLAVSAGDYFEVFFQTQADTSITVYAAWSYFSAMAVG